ncbi:MAG TPA: phage holin family protein [Steroidobacteraceae bacterium]|nr:phage holin family protein [Steroidobacteraceae bacterium]
MLWLLPKAAPALLRHIAAYIELAAFDLEQSRRDIAPRVIASVVAGLGLFFALLMGCAAVVAVTWDTPHRLAAIVWMGCGFLAIAAIAVIYRARASREQAPFLASVRREWQEDRVILERLLSEHDG